MPYDSKRPNALGAGHHVILLPQTKTSAHAVDEGGDEGTELVLVQTAAVVEIVEPQDELQLLLRGDEPR